MIDLYSPYHTWEQAFDPLVRVDYDDAMAKRSDLYAGEDYESPYPPQDQMVRKLCDICGIDIVVNNWPDRKSRTPAYKKFVVCADCDPRHPEDRYMKEGYRILYPRRLHIIKMAMIVRAIALRPCSKGRGLALNCKCPECVAGMLMPPF